jgi:acyl-coenzyme A thioesterase PaaI-like protein
MTDKTAMNKKLSKLIDKLLLNSENTVVLKTLQKLFNTGIPFNLPHKFKFIELSDRKTRLSLPYKRVNKNHLGGMHACAIATLGEYPAGLTLIKRFGSAKYRLIMGKLEGDYIKQGRGDLIGEVTIAQEEFERVEKELSETNKSEITIATNILNESEEIIAVIQTTWQLKSWESVTFKG